jgi:RNA polymerase sigma-70 factor (ECF subfamily)
MPAPSDITSLLIAWSDGDQAALENLLPLIERELRRIARHYMRRENPGHTLQTTALVNEAYFRLVDQKSVRWQNRAHFYAIAAKIMRRILLNYARDRRREKRGGGAVQVSLSEVAAVGEQRSAELISLDEAMQRLATFDERKCRVVELRYFGGLSVEETAEVLGVSVATVDRDWKAAKAWLARELKHEE